MKGNPMTRAYPRWTATVNYSSDNGPLAVIHEIEELAELHDLIENGPDWNAILEIKIELTRRSYDVTVEEAKTI